MLKFFFSCLTFCLISLSVSALENDAYGKKPAMKKNKEIKKGSNKIVGGNKKKAKKGKRKVVPAKTQWSANSSKKGKNPKTSSKSSSKNVSRKSSLDDFTRNKGTFDWPLEEGTVKTGFGPYKAGYGAIMGYNPGLTLEAAQGSCVQSVFEGVVKDLFEMDGNWGVTIQHGNYFTVYSNLAMVNVAENDKIVSGAVIGKAACNNEGNAELEFLLLKNNKNIDPKPWIRKN